VSDSRAQTPLLRFVVDLFNFVVQQYVDNRVRTGGLTTGTFVDACFEMSPQYI